MLLLFELQVFQQQSQLNRFQTHEHKTLLSKPETMQMLVFLDRYLPAHLPGSKSTPAFLPPRLPGTDGLHNPHLRLRTGKGESPVSRTFLSFLLRCWAIEPTATRMLGVALYNRATFSAPGSFHRQPILVSAFHANENLLSFTESALSFIRTLHYRNGGSRGWLRRVPLPSALVSRGLIFPTTNFWVRSAEFPTAAHPVPPSHSHRLLRAVRLAPAAHLEMMVPAAGRRADGQRRWH